MENLLLRSIAPQSVQVYNLLIKAGPLTASRIGRKMGILPNTAYRNLKELMRIGFVQKSGDYPATYAAKSKHESVGLYTNIILQNFEQAFAAAASTESNLKISFFQNRTDLLKSADKDGYRAQRSINRIISGDVLPAESTLAMKLAIERGVRIRTLVQGNSKGLAQTVRSWKQMGMEVKHTPNMNTRIVTYDGTTSYFASYNPSRHQEAMGVRFDYTPLTALMDELFEQKWTSAI